jgi:hypothetical protein
MRTDGRPSLPPDLAALTTDPRRSLHDGRFHEFVVDTRKKAITIAIDCGDLQVGYRRLTLSFEGASIVPDDLQRLAAAVGAEFRANHWHRGRTVTEVLDSTVDALPDGRFALRLRLFPFYQFAVEFSEFSLVEVSLAARGPGRAGRFKLFPPPE